MLKPGLYKSNYYFGQDCPYFFILKIIEIYKNQIQVFCLDKNGQLYRIYLKYAWFSEAKKEEKILPLP